MKKAIKLTAAALAATLSLSLAACGSSASTGTARPRHPPTVLFTARWTKSRRTARSTSAFSLTRTRSATSTKTASIRAMTSTLPTAWPRIWASR